MEMAVLQLLVHLTLQKNLQKIVDKKASDCYNNIRRQEQQPRKPKIWGISSAGSPVGIKTHPQSDSPATIKFPTKNSIQEVRFLDFMGD